MAFIHSTAPAPSRATQKLTAAKLTAALRDERARYASLTSREREIFDLVTEGCSTRQAAIFLRINRKTAENIRARMMEKIGVTNVAHLVRFASRHQLLGVSEDIPW